MLYDARNVQAEISQWLKVCNRHLLKVITHNDIPIDFLQTDLIGSCYIAAHFHRRGLVAIACCFLDYGSASTHLWY